MPQNSLGQGMRGSSQQNGSGRLVFPIVAILLIFIASLVFVSNRNDGTDVINAASLQSETKSPSMRLTDKIIIPLSLMTVPLRGGEKMIGDVRARSDVFAENQRLKARLTQLADAEMRANALAMKIKRFESLLSADVGLDIPVEKIAARVVSENNGPFARSALLNAGAAAGVRVGHAVMTEEGLYGHVIAVGKRSSRVLLLQDINSRIAVMSPRSEARAIMVGTNANEPNLQYVAREADWMDGDSIVTSGDEGVLPRGLPVGVMKQRGANKRSVILNSVGMPVDWVWVYPFEAVKTPEEDPVLDVTDESLPPTVYESRGVDSPAQGAAVTDPAGPG